MDSWILSALTGGATGVALSAALAFLLRSWIIERLKAAVSFEYQEKLEAVKLEHNQLLERFREERAERESIRSLALSSLTSMQAGVLQRRLQAIEEFWKSLREIRASIPSFIFIIDMVGYQQRNFGRALEDMLRSARPETMLQSSLSIMEKVSDLRPFIGERLYALFFSLQVAYGRATSATVMSYQQGGIRKWYEDPDMQSLLRAALTESELQEFLSLRSENLDWLRRNLEEKIVQEISVVLSGRNTASDNLTLARQVIAAATSVASHGAGGATTSRNSG